jgi:hypothetical protein
LGAPVIYEYSSDHTVFVEEEYHATKDNPKLTESASSSSGTMIIILPAILSSSSLEDLIGVPAINIAAYLKLKQKRISALKTEGLTNYAIKATGELKKLIGTISIEAKNVEILYKIKTEIDENFVSLSPVELIVDKVSLINN